MTASPIWMIFISIVGSVIALLLGVIGFLLKFGIDKICREIQKIWDWITADTKDTTGIKSEIQGIKERCAVLHPDHPHIHKRISD